MQRIKQAAIKLVEQSEFKYKMTANAKEQGLQRLGKQEALLKARAAYRQELYMVSDSASVSERFQTSSRVDGVVAMPHRLDAVDVAA